MVKSAAVYVRISEDREGAGLGVERQEGDCRDLAERLGWTVADVYVDNDVSAYTGKPRPGYQRMLKGLKSGAVDSVLVWHTDRLHRSPTELETYVEVCEQHGIDTHTVKAGPLDLRTPSGRLVARQLGAVARYEIEHNVERLKAARLQNAKAGKWAGGRRPFGFEADGVTPREREANELAAATDAVLAGTSLRSIAADWNEREVWTSTGREWKGTEVRRVLLRPRNAGLMQHQGEVIGEAEWPAVVDPDRWRACRAVLTDTDRRTSPLGGPRHYLGSGIYRCGVCDDGTTMHVSSGEYICSGPVSHLARQSDPVDELVTEIVLQRLSGPDAAELLAPPTEDTSGLHTDAQALREQLDELARLYADGDVDARQLAEASGRLRERLEAVESKIAETASGTALADFAGRDPEEVWDELDLDRRTAVVDTLLEVTILPAPQGRPKGWQPGEPYFHPESIGFEWKGAR